MCGGKVAVPPIVKEKRRNSEKRKEKSRDAARCRRSKESEIFSDMASHLPLEHSVVTGLDKASIMRLTVGFFKVKEMLKILIPHEKTKCSKDPLYATVLNGFLLILSEDGDIVYLSENVEEFIGITQVEMLGHSVFEFSHPCDHEEIKALLSSKNVLKDETEDKENETISLFVRMKSSLKPKGRTMNLKSATYQVIHYMGHKFDKPSSTQACPAFYLMFIGKTIPHPAQIDVPLDKQIFISRHSLDMKFTHIDEKLSEYLGYKSSELLGQSVYSFHHALDSSSLLTSFKTLFSKGQCETGYYRFLSKHGGYIWVVTQATLIYENGKEKPECVVCLNYVLSKTENQNEILSCQQEKAEIISEEKEEKKEGEALAKPASWSSNTSATFTFKDPDMSKDSLGYCDTDILLFPESLKDSKLQLDLDLFPDDPYDICDDPFISYRDDSLSSPESSLNLPTSNSTSPVHFNTTTPNTPDSSSMPDVPSLDSLNLELKFTMPPSVNADDLRAPFATSEEDLCPFISPSNSVMWGPQEPKKSPPPPPPSLERTPDSESIRIISRQNNENSLKSSLAALLQSDVKKPPITTATKQQEKVRKELSKRWPAAQKNTNVKQKHFTPSRNSNNHSSSGHIIMLDTIPMKKQVGKSGVRRQNDRKSPPFGSHVATVKVNDRLIKVQVSVSELPTSPIEHKQPFPSPPDPPPKRFSPSCLGPAESPKRLKVDNGLSSSGPLRDSVLLNLLISGEDASRGYLCSGKNRCSDTKNDSFQTISPSDVNDTTELLASDSELLDSFLKISQYDAEINAPIQSSHLLQGDDLLNALDHTLLLRNVPTLV